MWCWYSNVTLPSSVSATSLPRRRRKDISISTNHQQVGESGQSLVTSLQSNTIPISKQESEQISGSDILWALQKASDSKKMKMKKKTSNSKVEEQGKKGKGSSSMEDYTNLRPLCINPQWAPKLDEFQILLRQLSHTI